MWNLEKWYRNLTCKTEIETHREQIYDIKEGIVWDELGDWNRHINTIDTVYKIDH